MTELARKHGSARPGRVALVFALLAARAYADEAPRVTLVWHAPAGCPEREAVLARVEQLLGAPETPRSGAPLDVREFVTLTPDDRFRAELATVHAGVERSRSLDAATCSEIAEASAVVIALAISPAADASDTTESRLVMPELDSPPSASAPPPSPTSGPPDHAVRSPRATTPTRQGAFRPRVAAGFAADLGAVAPLAPGVSAAGGFRCGPYVELGLRGSFFPERSSALAGQPNQGVRVLLAAAAPLICAAPFELPAELAACGEVELGYLHASGFGPPTHYHRSAWWVAPGVGLTAAYPARSRFRTRLAADALFPLSRTEFVLTNAGVPHRLPVVAPRLGLYLELVFP